MKRKIVVLIGLALCTMLLVSPALASDAGTLEIYGNANEDDTIDMRDLTYVKLIFFGKKPETELADAKHDGKINPLDFIQIKLIIVGKEKELTVVDSADRIVTVKKPVGRIVTFNTGSAEMVRTLKVQDKVVGVLINLKDDEIFFPELSKLPSVGSWSSGAGGPDYEKMFELDPDIVITYTEYTAPKLAETLELAGITLVRLDLYKVAPEVMVEEVKKMGYILDKKEEAEEFIDWYNEIIVDIIKARTEKVSDDDKPRVYLEAWGDYSTFTKGSGSDMMIILAGGRNICADLPSESGFVPDIDPEWLVQQNPEIIVRRAPRYVSSGYGEDSPSEMKAARDALLSRPELAGVTAIMNDDVYILSLTIATTTRNFIGSAYMAKWFHPDLFEDLDPQAIHQEYLDRFQHINYDLDEHGVFVYPPLGE